MAPPIRRELQTIPEETHPMELTNYVKANEAPKKPLSLEQKQACRVAELKAEVAKMNRLHTQVVERMDQIIESAKTARSKMVYNNALFEHLSKILDDQKPSNEALSFAKGCLWGTAEFSTVGTSDGSRHVQKLFEDAEVALHLVKVETETREKMALLADVKAEGEE